MASSTPALWSHTLKACRRTEPRRVCSAASRCFVLAPCADARHSAKLELRVLSRLSTPLQRRLPTSLASSTLGILPTKSCAADATPTLQQARQVSSVEPSRTICGSSASSTLKGGLGGFAQCNVGVSS